MRVFVAGASGAIGSRLVPQLIGRGHEVTGTFRSPAAATVLALESGRTGVYNIVDDDPAALREWLPVLAAALGAKPPRHAPAWLARLIAGEGGVIMATQSRGASNAKAKRELGWTLRYPSWRQGFPAAYSPAPGAAPAGAPSRAAR